MAYERLNYEERIHISILFKEQWSLQSIAVELDRSIGTISREIKRGCFIEGDEFVYSAAAALQRASEQAQLSHRKSLILEQDGMIKLVIPKLRKRWSPNKISVGTPFSELVINWKFKCVEIFRCISMGLIDLEICLDDSGYNLPSSSMKDLLVERCLQRDMHLRCLRDNFC